MTDWIITLVDGGRTTVACEEVTTRQSGDLWCLAALDPKPAPLRPVLILAAGRWHAAHPADVNPLPDRVPG